MKRVPILAFLLAIVPFAWAADVPTETDGVVSDEAVDAAESNVDSAASAADAVSPDAPAESTGSAETKAVPVEAVPSSVDTAGGFGASHKVVRGDTLWDLAGTFLKDPFLWPKIFEANREKIEIPQLIYPNQEFVIPSIEAAGALAETPAAASPADEPVAAVEKADSDAASESESGAEAPAQAEDMDAAAAPEKKMIESAAAVTGAEPEDMDEKSVDEREAKKKKSMAVPGAGFMGGMADSFLADENWEYDGYVLRDRDQRMMISQGDVVFLNIGAASGVKPKMVANVYRVGKKVKDPYLKKKTGRMVKRVGSVIVTGQVTDEGCTAVVTNSLEPIRIGDIVKFAAK